MLLSYNIENEFAFILALDQFFENGLQAQSRLLNLLLITETSHFPSIRPQKMKTGILYESYHCFPLHLNVMEF